MPGYECILRTARDKKCNLTAAQIFANIVGIAKTTEHKTQCTETTPTHTCLPNRKLCKQHTETNIEIDKSNIISPYFHSTQGHAQNTHDNTINKSNLPTKNATHKNNIANVNAQN